MNDVVKSGPCRRFADKLGLGLESGMGSGTGLGQGSGSGSGSGSGLGGGEMPYLVAVRLVDREGVLNPAGYADADEEWPGDDVEGDEFSFYDSQQYLEAALFGTMHEDVNKAYNPMICCSHAFDAKIRVAMMQGSGNATSGNHPHHSHSHGQHTYPQQQSGLGSGPGSGSGQGVNRGGIPPPSSVYSPMATTPTPATAATGMSGKNNNIGGSVSGGTGGGGGVATGRSHVPHAAAQLELKTKPSRNTIR